MREKRTHPERRVGGGGARSGLEGEGEADGGALVEGLGVELAGDSEDAAAGLEAVLEERCQLAAVVELGLDSGGRVQLVEASDGEGVLVVGEPPGHLGHGGAGVLIVQMVHVGSPQRVPLFRSSSATRRRRR